MRSQVLAVLDCSKFDAMLLDKKTTSERGCSGSATVQRSTCVAVGGTTSCQTDCSGGMSFTAVNLS